MNPPGKVLHTPILRTAIIFGALISVPILATAQSIITNVGGCDFETGWFQYTCILSFIQHLVRFVFGLTGGFFLIMLLLGGYQYAIGAALPGKDTSAGKQRIQFAIAGFLVSLLSFFIIEFIVALFTGADISP